MGARQWRQGRCRACRQTLQHKAPVNLIICQQTVNHACVEVLVQCAVLAQVIPKVRNGLTGLSKATEEHKPLLGHLLYVAAQVGS